MLRVLLVVVAVMGAGCGSTSSTGTGDVVAATVASGHPPAAISRSAQSATVHSAEGRQRAGLTLAEPQGVILLYRLSAPAGTDIHGRLHKLAGPAGDVTIWLRVGPPPA